MAIETPRERLMAGVGALRTQADVIENAGDQQELEDALKDVEAAVQSLRQI